MARVLIVEDEPDILLVLENRMRSAGHEVSSAIDGEQAIELIIENAPDLVILDWMMPKLDGLAVCQRLREHDAGHLTKVLMLTAKSQQSAIARARAAGADDCIVKPFSSRDLIDRVAALTGQ